MGETEKGFMEMSVKKQKQPIGLYWLFMTELWERFGFYTIQTIAVLYLSKGLGFSDSKAFLTVAGLNAMLYLTPVPGGMLADKIMGYQRAIMVGGALLAVGYMTMAVPTDWGFFLGAAIVIAANGFFKPNVSSIVGDLYKQDDPRRDGGFTIFYMGINVGALLPSLFIGWLVAHYGWHSGFLVAMGGMLLSLIVFFMGKKYLLECGRMPKNSLLKTQGAKTWGLIALGTVVIVAAAFLLFEYTLILNLVVISASLLCLLYVLFLTLKQEVRARNKMFACLILIGFSIGFNVLYNQTFTSLMLFADRNMVPFFLGIPITAENTQFFNPFFIIVLSPLLAAFWIKLARSGLNPSVAYKFSYAIFLMTMGFAVLWLGVTFFNVDGMTASGWLVASYFLQTSGELLINPVGLAMITVLAPRGYVGLMMGMWFLSNTAAFSLSGLVATVTSVPDGSSLQQASNVYASGFGTFALISLVVALLSIACAPFISHLIKGDKLSDKLEQL